MSIRLRLTLWYTTILAVVIAIFGTALYSLLTYNLLNSIDQQLAGMAQAVSEAAQVRISPFSLEKIVEVPDLDVLTPPGLYIQVYGVDAREVLDRSGTLGDLTLPLESTTLRAALARQAEVRDVTLGGQLLRLHNRPLIIGGNVEGIVQVATSLAQVDQTQRQLLSILVSGALLALLISGALGALLARVALRPIDQITQTALAISRTEDLTRRLNVREPLDEVGRLSATFNEMLARLETLFRTQRRFVADVSHELRTPLTTIQGNLDLLRRGVAEDPQVRRETLADIEGELARMSRLVADLLLLARMDAGVHLEPEPVELDTLLLQVYRQARLMADGVDVRLGHEDQAVVMGDADRLRQLLLNLVDNALKYTPAGGQVTLSLYNEGNEVRVAVADTGAGIPPQDLEPGPNGLPMVFERFYRADPARTRGGTGLGLSIVHWIVQIHGGRIEVESEVGRGSTFTVWLPADATTS
ncbi:MAG TPA: ATP-binding protein [Anaerolineae bacterium]|nr:ATP-binding protein [Anaerolineae bacterium]